MTRQSTGLDYCSFLIIAYKELRRLEHAILERLAEIDVKHQVLYAESKINIESFYGIELDDFAVEVAILSLWIAKHQMNAEFKEKFNLSIPLIPLKETGQIREGNAARVDWHSVCPNDGDDEIYLIGNPPYLGSSMQASEQKADFAQVFGAQPFSPNLDYISLWFVRGASYIEGTAAQLAFVTTNSVAQGDHVGLMFPIIFAKGVEIGFAHTSFRWENNAKRNAGVTVAVISLRNAQSSPKYIYSDDLRLSATNINGYLADAPSVYLGRRSTPLGGVLPRMTRGSQPSDGGHLIFEPGDRTRILRDRPDASRFIKRYMDASAFINDGERYCIWVEQGDADAAAAVPALQSRLAKVAEFRLGRRDAATRAFAAKPWQFKQPAYRPTDSIIVPRHSSEHRDYIPMGYLDDSVVISDAAFGVYDAEPWVFALLTSRMHMVWTRAVCGRLKSDYRYSNTIVYNNLPIPRLSDGMRDMLTLAALRVLDVREHHCENTLGQLYDPDLMPGDLRAAHDEVDTLVDSLYSKRGYETDEQRLSDLFVRYEAMTAAETTKGTKK